MLPPKKPFIVMFVGLEPEVDQVLPDDLRLGPVGRARRAVVDGDLAVAEAAPRRAPRTGEVRWRIRLLGPRAEHAD